MSFPLIYENFQVSSESRKIKSFSDFPILTLQFLLAVGHSQCYILDFSIWCAIFHDFFKGEWRIAWAKGARFQAFWLKLFVK